MEASFAEVLAHETTTLAGVADAAALDRWRRRLVDEATTPESAYAKVLRPAGDPQGRVAFLDRWRDLIAAALARVVRAASAGHTEIDVDRIAVSILAALYGGTILSRVAKDSSPLRVSVELALAPLLPSANDAPIPAGNMGPSIP